MCWDMWFDLADVGGGARGGGERGGSVPVSKLLRSRASGYGTRALSSGSPAGWMAAALCVRRVRALMDYLIARSCNA